LKQGREPTAETEREALARDRRSVRSYLFRVELPLTFGLGSAAAAERSLVSWPDGSRQDLKGLAADRLHRIQQGG
jgi:hypothetical protein